MHLLTLKCETMTLPAQVVQSYLLPVLDLASVYFLIETRTFELLKRTDKSEWATSTLRMVDLHTRHMYAPANKKSVYMCNMKGGTCLHCNARGM